MLKIIQANIPNYCINSHHYHKLYHGHRIETQIQEKKIQFNPKNYQFTIYLCIQLTQRNLSVLLMQAQWRWSVNFLIYQPIKEGCLSFLLPCEFPSISVSLCSVSPFLVNFFFYFFFFPLLSATQIYHESLFSTTHMPLLHLHRQLL